jgi:hypothetical protein
MAIANCDDLMKVQVETKEGYIFPERARYLPVAG